jgi:predicted RNase H-like nuclease (RuvC/YqgF family)
MDVTLWKAAIATLGTVLAAWLVYKGGRYTATKAKEGSDASTGVTAQDSALKAWEGLLTPYRDEVAKLRADVENLTTELSKERKQRAKEAEEQRKLTELLHSELGEWKRVAKVIAKWAVGLRDEVLRLGGAMPATPEELLVLQSLEDNKNTP